MTEQEAFFGLNPPVRELILGYLRRHPQAKDTIEGICQWWLLEERIVRAQLMIEGALDELAAEGWVLKEPQADGRVLYSANPARIPNP